MTDKELFFKYNMKPTRHREKNDELISNLKHYKLQFKHDFEKNQNFSVLLHATYDCNANCYYCENQYLKEHFKSKIISKENITQLLEKLGSHIDKIIFHGGEPTLLPEDLFTHIYNEKNRLNLKFQILLQTNGILLTEEKINFFNSLNINWGTSYNGLHNDFSRGTDSTNAILNIIKQHKNSFITVYDSNSCNNLIKNYEYYKKLGIGNFQSAFMRDIKTDDTGSFLLMEDENNYQAVYDYIKYWIYDNNKPIADRWVIRQIERVLGYSHVCDENYCIGKWIVVDPDGNLCHCGYSNNKNHIYCNLNDIIDINSLYQNENFIKFKNKQKKLIIEKCSQCEWIEVCHGGCMKLNFNHNENFEELNLLMCNFNKKILDYTYNLIKDIKINIFLNPIFVQILNQNCFFNLEEIKQIETNNEI